MHNHDSFPSYRATVEGLGPNARPPSRVPPARRKRCVLRVPKTVQHLLQKSIYQPACLQFLNQRVLPGMLLQKFRNKPVPFTLPLQPAVVGPELGQ